MPFVVHFPTNPTADFTGGAQTRSFTVCASPAPRGCPVPLEPLDFRPWAGTRTRVPEGIQPNRRNASSSAGWVICKNCTTLFTKLARPNPLSSVPGKLQVIQKTGKLGEKERALKNSVTAPHCIKKCSAGSLGTPRPHENKNVFRSLLSFDNETRFSRPNRFRSATTPA